MGKCAPIELVLSSNGKDKVGKNNKQIAEIHVSC